VGSGIDIIPYNLSFVTNCCNLGVYHRLLLGRLRLGRFFFFFIIDVNIETTRRIIIRMNPPINQYLYLDKNELLVLTNVLFPFNGPGSATVA
jgi:hypothetical protein